MQVKFKICFGRLLLPVIYCIAFTIEILYWNILYFLLQNIGFSVMYYFFVVAFNSRVPLTIYFFRKSYNFNYPDTICPTLIDSLATQNTVKNCCSVNITYFLLGCTNLLLGEISIRRHTNYYDLKMAIHFQ